jgi:hypothetical protein
VLSSRQLVCVGLGVLALVWWRLQGTDCIMWFSASLLLGSLRKRHIDGKTQAHLQMLDPFVPQLLTILQRTKVDRILTVCLRVMTILFNYPLPALAGTAKHFARCVLGHVHGNTVARASAGRSELSECALKATTSLLRGCQHVKVCAFPCNGPLCPSAVVLAD